MRNMRRRRKRIRAEPLITLVMGEGRGGDWARMEALVAIRLAGRCK